MLCFDGNSTNLTLQISSEWPGWDNPFYQLEVWKTLFVNTKGFFIAVLKGGPLYFLYLILLIFGQENLLPSVVFEKYPYFDLTVLMKSIIIYVAPFLFYCMLTKIKNRNTYIDY